MSSKSEDVLYAIWVAVVMCAFTALVFFLGNLCGSMRTEALLKEKAPTLKCPSCGSSDVSNDTKMYYGLTELNDQKDVFPVTPKVCNKCGFVLFFDPNRVKSK